VKIPFNISRVFTTGPKLRNLFSEWRKGATQSLQGKRDNSSTSGQQISTGRVTSLGDLAKIEECLW
jgi:hypothetical protein